MVANIRPYKNAIPPDRELVPGIWNDILDNWLASFETSERGNTALGVFVQDQTTEALDVPFLQGRGEFTLDGDTVIDSMSFDAVSGHNIAVDEILEFANVSTFMQARVLSVTGDTISMDTPFNHVYSNLDTMVRSSDDLLVNGSVTPVIFTVKPLLNQSGDMTRVIISIESTSAMDFIKFGSISALTNGCVLRVRRENGDFKNLTNFKTNGEFIEKSFDHTFQTKTGGGEFGFVSRLTFAGQSKHGVVIRLDGKLGEELQLIIQDDLSSGLTKLKVVAQGHELQSEP